MKLTKELYKNNKFSLIILLVFFIVFARSVIDIFSSLDALKTPLNLIVKNSNENSIYYKVNFGDTIKLYEGMEKLKEIEGVEGLEYLIAFKAEFVEADAIPYLVDPSFQRYTYKIDRSVLHKGEIEAFSSTPKMPIGYKGEIKSKDNSGKITFRIVGLINKNRFVQKNFSSQSGVGDLTQLFSPIDEGIFVIDKDLSVLKEYKDKVYNINAYTININSKTSKQKLEQLNLGGNMYYMKNLIQKTKDEYIKIRNKRISFPVAYFVFSVFTTISVGIIQSHKFVDRIKIMRLNGLTRKKSLLLMQVGVFSSTIISIAVSIILSLLARSTELIRIVGLQKESFTHFHYTFNYLKYFVPALIFINIVILIFNNLMLNSSERRGLIDDKVE